MADVLPAAWLGSSTKAVVGLSHPSGALSTAFSAGSRRLLPGSHLDPGTPRCKSWRLTPAWFSGGPTFTRSLAEILSSFIGLQVKRHVRPLERREQLQAPISAQQPLLAPGWAQPPKLSPAGQACEAQHLPIWVRCLCPKQCCLNTGCADSHLFKIVFTLSFF